MVCEHLWLLTKKQTDVRALDLVKAAVVACDSSRVRVVEEYSGGSIKVYIEIVSKKPCADYLTPLLKYVLGDGVRIVSSSCDSTPL
ncbi:MAG: hypothetical protein RMH84_03050 [Sulfolobales archaeon]|nr:hypothetical protein [Sulfolobales archaeon]MCX8208343.1 hypothetical protein [Sulfolobales archaeon]MDW8010554.1 hypothetical protein [Sulfolobales archaeon]